VLHSQIGPIAVHFPERIETNDELQSLNPDWDLSLIAAKTGIYSRTIAAPDETASDLAVKACLKLFAENNVDPKVDRLCAFLHADSRLSPPNNSLPNPAST
jgi:3-oxoacyl-[acyl-carrier-protein] synthase-3